MNRNIIFCFSGTGNSLKVAQDLKEQLKHCTICHMREEHTEAELSGYASVGFVFPVYYVGMPLQVSEFIRKLRLPGNYSGYLYAVITYAAFAGDTLKQVDVTLRQKGFVLHYGATMKMADNMVTISGKKSNLRRLGGIYRRSIPQVISDITGKRKKPPALSLPLLRAYHNLQVSRVHKRGKLFAVTEDCTGCGVCASVCPAGNLAWEKGKLPVFQSRCQQCMACIQLCPVKAIDYKNRCKDRPRYKHPQVSFAALRELNQQWQVQSQAKPRTVP